MKKFNVIFITIDSLRADHLGSFGYKRPTSPFLDRFAAKSLNFRSHFSNSSQSPPGFFSMFASVYPFVRKDWTTTEGNYEFISEVFQREGYDTVGFGSAPYISSFFGYDRGFDEFIYTGAIEEVDPMKKAALKILKGGAFEMVKKFVKGTGVGKAINRVRYFFLPQHAYASADELHPQIENFFFARKSSAKGGKKPLFLWLHYMDAHNPFIASKEDIRAVGGRVSQWKVHMLNRKHLQLTRFNPFEDVLHMTSGELKDLETCYDAKIHYLDRKLRDLFAFLEGAGLTPENSVIAITSDHGEAFGEHSGIGHTERLYNEVTHVPFFLSLPGEKPRAIDDLTNHIDLLPTIASAAGVPYMKRRAAGKDVRALLPRERYGHIFSQVAPNVGGMLSQIDFSRSVFAVRTKEWKFIRDFARNREELYDMINDPGELMNLRDRKLSVAEELSRILAAHIAKMKVFL